MTGSYIYEKKATLLGLSAACLGYLSLKWGGRFFFNKIFDSALKKIMTDLYDENIWEFVSATTRIGPQIIVETNLRAERGELINRPWLA